MFSVDMSRGHHTTMLHEQIPWPSRGVEQGEKWQKEIWSNIAPFPAQFETPLGNYLYIPWDEFNESGTYTYMQLLTTYACVSSSTPPAPDPPKPTPSMTCSEERDPLRTQIDLRMLMCLEIAPALQSNVATSRKNPDSMRSILRVYGGELVASSHPEMDELNMLHEFQETGVYYYPLGAGSARPNPQKRKKDTENPSCTGFTVLRRRLRRMG